jgi:hypothetical protein
VKNNDRILLDDTVYLGHKKLSVISFNKFL